MKTRVGNPTQRRRERRHPLGWEIGLFKRRSLFPCFPHQRKGDGNKSELRHTHRGTLNTPRKEVLSEGRGD